MGNEIYIVNDGNIELKEELENIFINESDYKFENILIDKIHVEIKNMPSLIILDEDYLKYNIVEIIKVIRSNEENKVVPIGVISSHPGKNHINQIMEQGAIFYIRKPLNNELILYTVKNLVEIFDISKRVSPLTGLPGNIQINTEITKRLNSDKTFAIIYLDLDNFKAYNDVYGFSQGDEIIKYTAKVAVRTAYSRCMQSNPFVGHIGGDDFVIIIDKNDYKKIADSIIKEFHLELNKYFDEESIKKGYIESINRKGSIEKFPLTTISIAIVEASNKKFKNVLEIAEVAAEVKKQAKQIEGSSYAIDKRKDFISTYKIQGK